MKPFVLELDKAANEIMDKGLDKELDKELNKELDKDRKGVGKKSWTRG